MEKVVLRNAAETEELGRRLAESLKPGTVIALMGDLGAGKTALTKAIAAGLGVREMITSPTFSIVQEYTDGRLPLYHFDVYRVFDPDELFEIGFEEYLYGRGICVIEWADQIEEILPKEVIRLRMEYGSGETERICYIERNGQE